MVSTELRARVWTVLTSRVCVLGDLVMVNLLGQRMLILNSVKAAVDTLGA